MNNLLLLLGGFFALVLIVAVASALLNKRANTISTTEFPYQRRDYLLSKAERSFYEVLHRTVVPDYRVFPKVRLADVIQVRRGTENWQSNFNRISSKHVDFLLCSAATLAPALVIELDDRSHSSTDGKAADAFRTSVFHAAGVPLLRIPARSTYNSRDLAAQIQATLSNSALPVT